MDMRAWMVLASAGVLAAQNPMVVPASHALNEGTSTTNVPFGRSTPTRVQCVYDPMLFAGPVTITAIALRADGGATVAAKVVDCELRMSTMPGGVLGLSSDFASNRGPDETVVLARQLLSLPAQATAATPNPFLPPIALGTPFAYDPAHGCLCLEVVVFGQPPGVYALDLTYACDSPMVPIGPPSCPQSSTMALRVESSTTQVMWGRPWVARVLDAAPGAMVTLVLGSIENGPWSGFVLPQDLAVIGAPGCYLSIDIGTSFFGTAAGDGSAVFPFVIPNVPWALGSWIRFQGGALDAGANALGIVTSQAQKVQVCGWEPVGRLWASGTAATSGTREIGVAPVVELTVQ
ncbi:MAG: hypothetical protein U1E73_13590 [Planctomycetota bacterium]